MHSKFKTLTLILTALIVIVTVSAGVTFAADNKVRLAAALANINGYIRTGRYISYIKDITLYVFLPTLTFCRIFLFRRQPN